MKGLPLLLLLSLATAACSGNGASDAPEPTTSVSTTTAGSSPSEEPTAEPTPGPDAPVYVSLGDSWPEGAHCNGCRTFPEMHAEGLAKVLDGPLVFVDLAGQAQPFFDTPGGGGAAGLLRALRRDSTFRREVARGDVIVIATGPNDGGDIFETFTRGTCGGEDDTACVAPLARTWHREFDAIVDEIRSLRGTQPTAIRLVNAANVFDDPASSAATRRGFAAFFAALTRAMCDSAEAHDAVCIDVGPVLDRSGAEQPVDDSSQESMDAVAALLLDAGVRELR